MQHKQGERPTWSIDTHHTQSVREGRRRRACEVFPAELRPSCQHGGIPRARPLGEPPIGEPTPQRPILAEEPEQLARRLKKNDHIGPGIVNDVQYLSRLTIGCGNIDQEHPHTHRLTTRPTTGCHISPGLQHDPEQPDDRTPKRNPTPNASPPEK